MSPVSWLFVIVVLKDNLIRFNPLNDHSAEQAVTGSVERIFTKADMFGYMELRWRKVSVRLVGKLFLPWSLSCFYHFITQPSSSLSRHWDDGKSFSYRSPSSLMVEMN